MVENYAGGAVDRERMRTDPEYLKAVMKHRAAQGDAEHRQRRLRFDLAAEIGARIYNSAEPVPVDPDRFAAVVDAALKAYRSGANL